MGDQKCPSIFFILCTYIEHVYIFTYIDNKTLSLGSLWVSKFDLKLGVGEHHFRNYPMYVSFQIFGSKFVIFLSCIYQYFENHPFFSKISTTFFLSFKIENIRYRTRYNYMLLIKDFSKDFSNPRARSARPTMRTKFSKLGVFVKIMARANSAKWGREVPDALLISTNNGLLGSSSTALTQRSAKRRVVRTDRRTGN